MRKKSKQAVAAKETLSTGFEPVREDPIRFQV